MWYHKGHKTTFPLSRHSLQDVPPSLSLSQTLSLTVSLTSPPKPRLGTRCRRVVHTKPFYPTHVEMLRKLDIARHPSTRRNKSSRNTRARRGLWSERSLFVAGSTTTSRAMQRQKDARNFLLVLLQSCGIDFFAAADLRGPSHPAKPSSRASKAVVSLLANRH